MPQKKRSNQTSDMGKKLRQKIIDKHDALMENLETKNGPPEERGDWLNRNKRFDQSLVITSDLGKTTVKQLLNRLLKGNMGYKEETKTNDLNILCANLLTNRQRNPTSISLSRNSYTRTRYNKVSPFIIKLIHMMEDEKYIQMNKGYNFPKESRKTRIWPTQKMLDNFPSFNSKTEVAPIPIELVHLKNTEKKLIQYLDTNETNRIRKILSKCNQLNRETQIQIRTKNGLDKVETDLHAVFNNGNFNQGGRLYTGQRGYQFLSKKERSSLYINKRATVELDFSGLHPRLLYAKEDIQYNEDPYAEISDKKELRPLLKNLLLILLNAENENQAISSGNLEFCYKEYQQFYELLKKEGLTIAELTRMYKKTHSKIAKHFCKKTCFEMMNLDSKIALSVIEHFVKLDVPILAIHDSFIVEKCHEEKLRETMQNAYKKHSGGFECPVDRN